MAIKFTFERSVIAIASQKGHCGGCWAPLRIGDTRFIEVSHGTFAVGCTKDCAAEAAQEELEKVAEIKRRSPYGGQRNSDAPDGSCDTEES